MDGVWLIRFDVAVDTVLHCSDYKDDIYQCIIVNLGC